MALQTEETIAFDLTKRHEGNVLNPIDSHYNRRGRQEEKRHTWTGCGEASWQFPPLIFSLRLFWAAPAESWLLAPHAALLWGSREPINVCSQRGKSIQKANCSPRPWAMKKWDRQRQTVQARGLTTCFLCCYTERNNMITAPVTCSKYNTVR